MFWTSPSLTACNEMWEKLSSLNEQANKINNCTRIKQVKTIVVTNINYLFTYNEVSDCVTRKNEIRNELLFYTQKEPTKTFLT